MRWAEVATSRGAITRVLSEHGLGPRAPPVPRTAAAVPPEQLQLPFGVVSR
ncbi:MAG: hypothetical protein KF718_07815 [Polyangiaceae bacterium]|nr:hypothetical protein [Polyangiaceae bacterium]